jgi:hypothetical protein
MRDNEKLHAQMIENAAEINRLTARVHATVKRRDESEELREEWVRACEEAHRRYEALCLPGGPYPEFYERIKAGDPEMIEVALCFLEVRPYFFRSGYHWKTILQKCKQAPMSGEQAERFAALLTKYTEWRKFRKLSSARGKAVRSQLWPLLRRFYDLFPTKLSDGMFDGLVTVGDLYALLCKAFKVEPLSDPGIYNGTARKPFPTTLPKTDTARWARNYHEWRTSSWRPEDIWATLVATITDVYQLDESRVVTPKTILRPDAVRER